MAIGVLMQRDTLIRASAYERLSRMASAAKLTMDQQAEILLDAVEVLVAPKG